MSVSISKGSYGNYSSGNYSGHCQVISIGSLDLYFSYNTVVAFRYNGDFKIRVNDWSSTTGRHLNWINSDKKKRIEGSLFEQLLNKVLKKCKLTV